MPETKKESNGGPGPEVDYEQRISRMINRWSGIQSTPRSDQDRQVNEIFTSRVETTGSSKTSEYIVGTCTIFQVSTT